MRKLLLTGIIILIILIFLTSCEEETELAEPEISGDGAEQNPEAAVEIDQDEITLPEPSLDSSTSIEQAIKQRRSRRAYSEQALKLADLGQLLWSAQGITRGRLRAAPSAGETYPLELYVVAGNAEGISPGIYHYIPETHALEKIKHGDLREELGRAALGQMFVAEAPAAIVITAGYDRTTSRYGQEGEKYVHMEAGHAAQNLYLQAESLGISTVAVGAMNGKEVKEILGQESSPLYVMPAGYG